MKKLLLLLAGLLPLTHLFGQSDIQKPFLSDPINHPMTPLYLVMGLLFIVILLTIVVALYLIRIVNSLTQQAEKDKATKLGVTYAPTPGWWQRFVQRMNASVPVAREKEIEMDHAYDGIRELDNHLPPWWKWLFYGSIAWAVIYFIVFHVTDSLPLSIEEYNTEIAMAEAQAKKLQLSQPASAIDENTLVFTQDAAIIEHGKSVFMNNACGSCHRNDGGGNTIGPNLTDEYWLHGGEAKNIFTTIKNGVVEKGMPAWGKVMSPQDVRDVVFFIISLKGSNPVDAKAPQGEQFTQNANVKADSTTAQAAL